MRLGEEDLQDIIQTPVLDAQAGEGLSPHQARAVLDYFVSCGDRLSQMTKTYHDVEAVTRLLQVSNLKSRVSEANEFYILSKNVKCDQNETKLSPNWTLETFNGFNEPLIRLKKGPKTNPNWT